MQPGDVVQCWKVVDPSPIPSQYLSLFVMGEYCLKYRDGETTEKIQGSIGVFAFSTLEAAREYAEVSTLARIIEGEGVVRQSRGIRAYHLEYLSYSYSHKKSPTVPVPEGTILLESFRMIKRIPQEEST